MRTYTHTCIQDLAYNVKSALENEPLLRVPKLACNAPSHKGLWKETDGQPLTKTPPDWYYERYAYVCMYVSMYVCM